LVSLQKYLTSGNPFVGHPISSFHLIVLYLAFTFVQDFAMTPYTYSKLRDPAVDIRLLELLPGDFHDKIRVRMSHVPLLQPQESATSRWSLSELKATLPNGWLAMETVEGRYIFQSEESDDTSWTHPDPQVNLASYDLVDDPFRSPFEPKFEALSYTWGSARDLQVIAVEQQEAASSGDYVEGGRCQLKIQQNLTTALRYLRYQLTTRTLWVDAVCINQKDIAERNSQVGRMRDMYKLSNRVVIWLGPESKNSQLALFALDYLGKQQEYTKNACRVRSPDATHPDWYLSYAKLPYDEQTWQSILDLVNRSWFERFWVTQEVQLASRTAIVRCGDDEIPWSRFRRALNCIVEKEELPLSGLRYRLERLRSLGRYLVGQPLQVLLNDCQTRLCSDPRDKVYGLLGLASENMAGKIKPRYSAPVAEVYLETSLVLLDQTKRLSFLYCGHAGSKHTMPSWVPDWCEATEIRSSGLGFSSGISCAHAKFKPPDMLQVQGLRCGTVRSVSKPIAVEGEIDLALEIGHWFKENIKTESYPSGGTSTMALAATIVINRFRDRFPEVGHRYPAVDEWTAQIHDYLVKPADILHVIFDTFSRTFREEQVLFVTESGHIGLTAGNPKPGNFFLAME
jgi:hypothetical protein